MNTILDLRTLAIYGLIPWFHLAWSICIWHLMEANSMRLPTISYHKRSRVIDNCPKFITLLWIEYWIMTMVVSLPCKFDDCQTPSLHCLIFMWVVMSPNMEPKQLGCHPQLHFVQCFHGIFSVSMPQWINILTCVQHAFPITHSNF